ncbi:ergothioneine biosynthesis protein EgtB, partial [bacterium]
FRMGDHTPETYDNESPAHEVEVAAFRLADAPVTASEWTRFIEAGGYADRSLWTEAGWTWLQSEGATRPDGWIDRDGGWGAIGPWGERALRPDEPVGGISFHEAEAYARWAGMRLPTETEWEYAAARAGGLYPWGEAEPTPARAVHGLENWAPAPVRSHLDGATPDGIHDLAGNVWEWTASEFRPYDGFRAYPYDGYSLDHMKGAHRALRGGSWATSPGLLRRTFRNFYVPTYRQGFLGLRLAADVD